MYSVHSTQYNVHSTLYTVYIELSHCIAHYEVHTMCMRAYACVCVRMWVCLRACVPVRVRVYILFYNCITHVKSKKIISYLPEYYCIRIHYTITTPTHSNTQ